MAFGYGQINGERHYLDSADPRVGDTAFSALLSRNRGGPKVYGADGRDRIGVFISLGKSPESATSVILSPETLVVLSESRMPTAALAISKLPKGSLTTARI